MRDHIIRQFDDLRGLDVPVALDPHLAAEIGRRRLYRRRGSGATAVAMVAIAVGWAVSTIGLDTRAREAGPPVASDAGIPSQSTAGKVDWIWSIKPRPAEALVQLIVAAGYSDVSSSGMTDATSDTHTYPVVSGDRVGYSTVWIGNDSIEPCATPVHPLGGAGRTCRIDRDTLGDIAVIEWANSEQGRTRMVWVEHGPTVVALTVSEGHPTYVPVADPDASVNDPNLLPWDLRNPLYPESLSTRTEPLDLKPLGELPFTESEQVKMARSFLGHTR